MNQPIGTGRFDYVAYDNNAQTKQESAKSLCAVVESFIAQNISCPRSKALAFTKLEEVYMWIGKGIRNDQVAINGSAPLQEGRGNA